MRILLAGDDGPSIGHLERTLRELGHELVGQARGLSVLPLAEHARPDVVVLDLDLPVEPLEPIVTRLVEELGASVVVVARPDARGRVARLARRGAGAIVRRGASLEDLDVALEVASARTHDALDLRRQAEEVQRERVRLLQVFAASADGIYIASRDGTLAMANDAAIAMLGLHPREMRGRRVAEFASDFRARTDKGQPIALSQLPLSRALRGEVVCDFEVWIDALDGEARCLSLSAAPVKNGESTIVEAVAVLRDVTAERLREQEAARRAERRRRELLALSVELLGAKSAEDLARRCVARVREALGADSVRFIAASPDGKTRVLSGDAGRPLPPRGTTMPPESLGLVGYVFLRNQTVRSDDLSLEDRFAVEGQPQMSPEDRAMVAAPLALGDRTLGVLAAVSRVPAAFDDDDAQLVTLMANQAAMALENLRLSEHIASEQKMAAVGVMAAGVVHEIKNPLTVIQANVESALELLDAISEARGQAAPSAAIDFARVDEDRSALVDTRNAVARLFKIVDDIKTYAHPGRATREPCDVNRLVEVALTLCASELRRWCRVTRSFGRLPEVSCDGAKVSQVVLNLLVNAGQAIERGGRMGTIEVATRVEEGTVHIVVADDGPGMDEATLAKVFLPFFTTKPAGVGTGLGLAISRSLMESQGGTIRVESEPGRGARFTVVLPLAAAAGTVAGS